MTPVALPEIAVTVWRNLTSPFRRRAMPSGMRWLPPFALYTAGFRLRWARVKASTKAIISAEMSCADVP